MPELLQSAPPAGARGGKVAFAVALGVSLVVLAVALSWDAAVRRSPSPYHADSGEIPNEVLLWWAIWGTGAVGYAAAAIVATYALRRQAPGDRRRFVRLVRLDVILALFFLVAGVLYSVVPPWLD
jgi:hypothetical protein